MTFLKKFLLPVVSASILSGFLVCLVNAQTPVFPRYPSLGYEAWPRGEHYKIDYTGSDTLFPALSDTILYTGVFQVGNAVLGDTLGSGMKHSIVGGKYAELFFVDSTMLSGDSAGIDRIYLFHLLSSDSGEPAYWLPDTSTLFVYPNAVYSPYYGTLRWKLPPVHPDTAPEYARHYMVPLPIFSPGFYKLGFCPPFSNGSDSLQDTQKVDYTIRIHQ